MAIVRETREVEGRDFDYTYSDAGMKIERDGCLYDEAYDPLNSGRTYTETDVPVESGEEATAEDYEAALERLGVTV